MKTKSAILVGVGGQGAILTAKVLVNGLMKAGYDVKMSEVHGMSQRGGSVSTQVHWGDKVYSPVIGEGAADLMVAFEKMEAVRYARFLKPDGIAVINDYELASSSIAAGLYNKGLKEREIAFDIAAAGLAGKWNVRDCWRQKDEGAFKGTYSRSVPGHATHLVRLTPGVGAWLRTRDVRDNAWMNEMRAYREVPQ